MGFGFSRSYLRADRRPDPIASPGMTDTVRSLIVTADDFGLAPEVNEAVEQAHRDGILTAASLMVGEGGCADAVRRARDLPDLAVGLHLTLVDGRPTLRPADIPDLVGLDGRFRTDLAGYGAAIFFRPSVQRQVAREIEAQFAAFAQNGLALDHVDSHKHFHIHPTVFRLLLAIGPRFGMRALRVPIEPADLLAQVEPTRIGGEARLAGLFARGMRRRARREGLIVADRVLGLAWSGAMTAERVAGLVEALPPGLSELYLHPAMAGGFAGEAAGYRYADELAALVAPSGAAALAARGVRPTSYGRAGRESTSSAALQPVAS